MRKNSLDLIAPDLSSLLAQAPEDELRTVAFTACTTALEKNHLVDANIDQALQALKLRNYGDSLLRRELACLVERLDIEQWDLQDKVDEGQVDQAAYEAAFKRARAVHAVYFALDPDPFVAATESLYEATAATDIQVIRGIVVSILGQP